MVFTNSPAPRYLVLAFAPRYGSRDEFIGNRVVVLGTCETVGWANRMIERDAGFDYDEIGYEIRDLHPERDLKCWGPKLPNTHTDESWAIWGHRAFLAAQAAGESDHLPF